MKENGYQYKGKGNEQQFKCERLTDAQRAEINQRIDELFNGKPEHIFDGLENFEKKDED